MKNKLQGIANESRPCLSEIYTPFGMLLSKRYMQYYVTDATVHDSVVVDIESQKTSPS